MVLTQYQFFVLIFLTVVMSRQQGGSVRFALTWNDAAKRDICLLPGEKNRDKGESRYSRHLAFGDESMREKKEMEGVTWLTKR